MLVYLLIVVNFQSWLDPFIIITALPAALAGIVLFLFFTGTTLSVPALMGAIMCMGVATANSILVVSFARERLAEHGDAVRAAIEAGFTRFRPVLMTALAMIIGMVPMALGLGEGGEQNAPLGRAVIGGLMLATVATLVFVPAVFALLHARRAPSGPAARTLASQPTRHEELDDVMLEGTARARNRSLGGAAAGERRRRRAAARQAVLVGLAIVAVAARRSGFTRHSRSRRAEAALATETTEAAVPIVERRPSAGQRARPGAGAAGPDDGLHRHADLCAHQRLSETAGISTSAPMCDRATARADRDARTRPAVAPGARADLATGAGEHANWPRDHRAAHREPACKAGQSAAGDQERLTIGGRRVDVAPGHRRVAPGRRGSAGAAAVLREASMRRSTA